MVDLVNELEGQVAIVTGSARNIGRATAMELARAGASLVINARESKELCEEVAHAIEANGGRAIPVVADITDRDAVDGMVAEAVKAFGGVDILVNNAAVRANVGFVDLDEETWLRAFNTSMQGSFNMSKACVPYMIERGGGSVIAVGGLSAYKGAPGRSHVMAAKDGLIGLTRGLAMDLGPHNIRANTVVVGVFDTERNANAPRFPAFSDLGDVGHIEQLTITFCLRLRSGPLPSHSDQPHNERARQSNRQQSGHWIPATPCPGFPA